MGYLLLLPLSLLIYHIGESFGNIDAFARHDSRQNRSKHFLASEKRIVLIGFIPVST